jgi:hypothetical protein
MCGPYVKKNFSSLLVVSPVLCRSQATGHSLEAFIRLLHHQRTLHGTR